MSEANVNSAGQSKFDDAIYKKFIAYELPPVVKGAVEGWTNAITAIAIIVRFGRTGRRYIPDESQTALFTGLQSTLLQILGPANTDTEPVSTQALRWFTYGGIIFNLGASTSAVFCLLSFSDLSTHARTKAMNPHLLPGKVLREQRIGDEFLGVQSEDELLKQFGMNPIWVQAKNHMLLCFILGVLCTFINVGIWARKQEANSLSIGILVCLGVVGLPLGHILFRLIPPVPPVMGTTGNANSEAHDQGSV